MSILTAITGVAATTHAEPTKPPRSLKAIATKRRQAFDTSVADARAFVVEILELANIIPSVTNITPEVQERIAAIRERRISLESYRHDDGGAYRADRRADELDRLHARKDAWCTDLTAMKHETIGFETVSLPKLESGAYRDGAKAAGHVLARSYSNVIDMVEGDQAKNEQAFQVRLAEADEVASWHPHIAQLLEAKGTIDRWIAETRNFGICDTSSFATAARGLMVMVDRRSGEDSQALGRAFACAEDWMLHHKAAKPVEPVATRKGK